MRDIFQAIKRSWTQHFIGQFSGFIILFLTYTAVLFIALSMMNIERLFAVWGEISKVTIYLNPKTSTETKTELESFLSQQPLIQKFHLVDSKQSAERFQAKFGSLSAQKINLPQLAEFLPEQYEIELNQKLAFQSNVDALDSFSAKVASTFSSVKSVSFGKSWLHRYINVLSAIHGIGWSLIVVFIVGTIILSSSVIKTILMSRKDEIEILEFIGANDSSIYLPQIVNAILLGFVSFSLALATNFYAFSDFLRSQESVFTKQTMEQLRFLPVGTILALAAICFAGLLLFSYFTVIRMMPKYQQIHRLIRER